MDMTVVRRDVDGEFLRLSDDGAGHYAKRLSTDTAWSVFDPQDLARASDAAVESVDTDLDAATCLVHYHASVRPLDLDKLRELLRLNAPLAAWRVSILAWHLCEHLSSLHQASIPQLVIHPQRIGRTGDRFVLLPTLAPVLAPVSQLPPNDAGAWLEFIDPDVLRTRGMDEELLPAGDVYSLGRTLAAICSDAWQTPSQEDALTLAERRVEAEEPDCPWPLPENLAALRPLIKGMCARSPASRAELHQLVAEIEGLVESLDAEARILRALSLSGVKVERELEEAEAVLDDLRDAHDAGLFGCSSVAVHVLTADVAMAKSSPDCNRALIELSQAETLAPLDAEIQLRLARAYLRSDTLPGHMVLSSERYQRAAGLSHWRADILAEWQPVLERLADLDLVLEHSRSVPREQRPRDLVYLRTRCLLDQGLNPDAWHEVAHSFQQSAFDEELYQLALEVAQPIDRGWLMEWMQAFRDAPGFAAPVSIVWAVIGNRLNADQYLAIARAYTPEMGS